MPGHPAGPIDPTPTPARWLCVPGGAGRVQEWKGGTWRAAGSVPAPHPPNLPVRVPPRRRRQPTPTATANTSNHRVVTSRRFLPPPPPHRPLPSRSWRPPRCTRWKARPPPLAGRAPTPRSSPHRSHRRCHHQRAAAAPRPPPSPWTSFAAARRRSSAAAELAALPASPPAAVACQTLSRRSFAAVATGVARRGEGEARCRRGCRRRNRCGLRRGSKAPSPPPPPQPRSGWCAFGWRKRHRGRGR